MTFSGDVADHYARYRRGFDAEALAFVTDRLRLHPGELAVDLGCGTGQLAIPLSSTVRHVVGVDPSPDMLAHARAAAGAADTTWLLGSDADVPALAGLLGPAVDAVTTSNAIHFMDTARLAATLPALLAPGGRIGVIAHGAPTWCQDSAWSAALAAFLAERYDADATGSRYTDEPTLARCRESLDAAGFRTTRHRMDRFLPVTVDWLCGNLFSAIPAAWIPSAAERPGFAADLTAVLRSAQPSGAFVEDAGVTVLVAHR